MRPSARFSIPATFGLAALLVTSLAVPACGGDGDEAPAVQNRLWLSKIPKTAKDEVGALLITKVGKRKQYGVLYRGSVVHGSFQMFEWQPEDEGGRAHMRLLHDDSSVKIRTEKCEPDAGFALCVLVHGDPLGEVRYQSRKYWGTRSRGAGPADFAAELRALAEDDADLAAALAGAEDMSETP